MLTMNDYGKFEKDGEDYSVLGAGDGFSAPVLAYGDIDYLNQKYLNRELQLTSSYNAILHDAYGDFINFPEELQDDKDIALSAVKDYGYNYSILSDELQNDNDILVATAQYFVDFGDDEGILEQIMEEHGNDRDFFLACVGSISLEQFMPQMFNQFSDNIKNDTSLVSELLFSVENERDVEAIKECTLPEKLFEDDIFKAVYNNIIMGESVDKVVEAYENKNRNDAKSFLDSLHEEKGTKAPEIKVWEEVFPNKDASVKEEIEDFNIEITDKESFFEAMQVLQPQELTEYFNKLPEDVQKDIIMDLDLNKDVRDWYMEAFESDELGSEIKENLMFRDIVSEMNENKDFYDIIGVSDSIVRERIMSELSDIINTDYTVIRNKNMLEDKAPDIIPNQPYNDEYVKALVSIDGMNLCHTFFEERKNKEIVELAVSKNPNAMRYASEDIVKEYLKEDGRNLVHMGDWQKNNKELVNIALESNSVAMYYVGNELRKDRDFVKESVAKYPNALYFLNEYKDNKPLVMRAVKADGLALKFASERLQGDKDIVMAAVKTYGPALEFASPKLKDDFEVVVEAMKTSKSAVLKYASDRVKDAIENYDKSQNTLKAKLEHANSMRKDNPDNDKGPKNPNRDDFSK